MPDDSGRAYLRRLAKNRLNTSAAYSRSMKKRPVHHTPMKNGLLNTKPDVPMKNAINSGNRQTGADVKVPPGNMNGPKNITRSKEVPRNGNRIRGVS